LCASRGARSRGDPAQDSEEQGQAVDGATAAWTSARGVTRRPVMRLPGRRLPGAEGGATMVAMTWLDSLPSVDADSVDHRVRLHGVSWEQFETLLDIRGDGGGASRSGRRRGGSRAPAARPPRARTRATAGRHSYRSPHLAARLDRRAARSAHGCRRAGGRHPSAGGPPRATSLGRGSRISGPAPASRICP